MNGENDNYDAVEFSEHARNTLLNDRTIGFIDSIVIFSKQQDNWMLAMQKRYADPLGVSEFEIDIPARPCLCTVVDMGVVGEFKSSCCRPAVQYAKKHGYEIDGYPYGIILQRGNENGRFERLLEIRVPVKP
ncbi:MAG: hypothetical protein LKF79_01265 [Solobacterium sp.]|nr:hypothetical protein [Solobacterium sp.]MCH4265257.1 hypothetical protein [Solobacterium sp.]